MIPVGILAVSHYAPERVVTNKDLESKLETTDEWIKSRTGISERRIAADSETSSSLGAKAALLVLDKAGLSPLDIDLVVAASMTPDTLLPAVALSLIHISTSLRHPCGSVRKSMMRP